MCEYSKVLNIRRIQSNTDISNPHISNFRVYQTRKLSPWNSSDIERYFCPPSNILNTWKVHFGTRSARLFLRGTTPPPKPEMLGKKKKKKGEGKRPRTAQFLTCGTAFFFFSISLTLFHSFSAYPSAGTKEPTSSSFCLFFYFFVAVLQVSISQPQLAPFTVVLVAGHHIASAVLLPLVRYLRTTAHAAFLYWVRVMQRRCGLLELSTFRVAMASIKKCKTLG